MRRVRSTDPGAAVVAEAGTIKVGRVTMTTPRQIAADLDVRKLLDRLRIAIEERLRREDGPPESDLVTDRATDAAAGRTSYRWRTKRDERVRPEHRVREGRVFEWAKDPPDGAPGVAFGCFPADHRVWSPSGGGILTRRHYDGPGVELQLEDRVIRATPNHPLLTTRGWVRADEIDEGDYLIHATREKPGAGDGDARESTFGEIAKLGHHLGTERAAGGEFHGDALVDDEIHVVGVHGMLGPDRVAPSDQDVLQLALSMSDVSALVKGAADPRVDGVRPAPLGGVSGARDDGPLLGGHPSHALDHRIAAASDGNPGLDKPPLESPSHDTCLAREGLARLAIQIAPDRVLKVRRDGLLIVGDVHNLSVPSGWYICNGIIVHNCRCHAEVYDDKTRRKQYRITAIVGDATKAGCRLELVPHFIDAARWAIISQEVIPPVVAAWLADAAPPSGDGVGTEPTPNVAAIG